MERWILESRIMNSWILKPDEALNHWASKTMSCWSALERWSNGASDKWSGVLLKKFLIHHIDHLRQRDGTDTRWPRPSGSAVSGAPRRAIVYWRSQATYAHSLRKAWLYLSQIDSLNELWTRAGSEVDEMHVWTFVFLKKCLRRWHANVFVSARARSYDEVCVPTCATIQPLCSVILDFSVHFVIGIFQKSRTSKYKLRVNQCILDWMPWLTVLHQMQSSACTMERRDIQMTP